MELRRKNILRLLNLLKTSSRLPCYKGNLGLIEIKPDERKKKKFGAEKTRIKGFHDQKDRTLD
jgi:hypothetical protein